MARFVSTVVVLALGSTTVGCATATSQAHIDGQGRILHMLLLEPQGDGATVKVMWDMTQASVPVRAR